MLSHPLNTFKIQKYYQNEPRFNGVYSRNNLPNTNDGAYVINPDESKSIGTHWIAPFVTGDNESASYSATLFDSFGFSPNKYESNTVNK